MIENCETLFSSLACLEVLRVLRAEPVWACRWGGLECGEAACCQYRRRFTGIRRRLVGSTPRRATSNVVTPSRLASPASANITGV